jgi:hypothetical protein
VTATIEELLAPISQALEADGFTTAVTATPGAISVSIEATPTACAECLSPPEVLEPLIQDILAGAGRSERVEVVYPAGWTGAVTGP